MRSGPARPRRRRPSTVDTRAGADGRPAPHPAGDDAQGARRRRRGPPGPRRLGSRPASRGSTTPPGYGGSPQARTAEQDSMRDYVALDGCRMEFLRRCLDDPGAVPCGRCDSCAGPRFTADVSRRRAGRGAGVPRPGRASRSRRRRCGRPGSTSCAASSSADEQALPGRAVGRLSDLGWGGRLRALLAPDTPDVALPDDVAGAVVEVLKAWAHGDDPWPARPVAVVAVASRRRPALVRSLAEHIAEVGRLPLLGAVLPTAGAPPSGGGARGNSAQRVRALHGAFAVPADLAAAVAAARRPGPAGRRPGRLRLDDDDGGARAAASPARRRCCRSPSPSPAEVVGGGGWRLRWWAVAVGG